MWESGGEPSNPTIAPAFPVVIEEDEPETLLGGVEDTAPTLPLKNVNLPALQEETHADLLVRFEFKGLTELFDQFFG